MKKYYLENMTQKQIRDFFVEMRISQREDIENLPYSIYNGILKAVHGKTKNGDDIVTEFTEFELIKIYNSDPSKYDQKKFQNYMCNTLENTNYKKDLNEYLDNHYNEL